MANVTRFDSAPSYDPPLHNNVDAKRLQGFEAGDTVNHWVGFSVYHPGATVDESPTRTESIYVVLEGELVVTVDGTDHVLGKHDSIHLNQGEVRSVENRTDADTHLLVAIANPKD